MLACDLILMFEIIIPYRTVKVNIGLIWNLFRNAYIKLGNNCYLYFVQTPPIPNY